MLRLSAFKPECVVKKKKKVKKLTSMTAYDFVQLEK